MCGRILLTDRSSASSSASAVKDYLDVPEVLSSLIFRHWDLPLIPTPAATLYSFIPFRSSGSMRINRTFKATQPTPCLTSTVGVGCCVDYRPNVDEVATMKDVKILVPLNCDNAFPLFVTVCYSGGVRCALVLSSARVGNNLLAGTPSKSWRGFKMGRRDKTNEWFNRRQDSCEDPEVDIGLNGWSYKPGWPMWTDRVL